MQAVARGQLEPDERLKGHLDRCLVCRSCEKVCPSQVPYGALIDEARSLFAPGQLFARERPSALQKLLDAVADKQGRLRTLARGVRIYQKSGMQWLARQSGLLRGLKLDGLEQILPEVPEQQQLRDYYPAERVTRGNVALFTGCIGEVMDDGTLSAAIRLLNRLGYGVHVPESQGCCGSLHQHSGEPGVAARLARLNRTAFSGLKIEAVIGTGSGCSAHLQEYAVRYGEAGGLEVAVFDICDFLATIDWQQAPNLKPLNRTVAVHEPCSSRNLMHGIESVFALLNKIPELQSRPLVTQQSCCGAAGSYMVTQPELAGELRSNTLAAIDSAAADMVVTTNIGCALHIEMGLAQPIELIHPVVLLERQLGND